MRQSYRFRRPRASWVLAFLAFPLFAQQAQDCPPIPQLANDTGMSNNANIHVYLYDTTAASWSTSTAAGSESDQVLTSIQAWTQMPGSNQAVDVGPGNDIPISPQTPSETLDDYGLLARGTASNPVVVIEWITPAQAASLCVRQDGSSSPACTFPVADNNNVATGAITYMSTDIKNGSLPQVYYTAPNSGSIANFTSHEVGGHDDMGWGDFPPGTNNEQNSAMGSGAYTSVGPKPCDIQHAIGCGR